MKAAIFSLAACLALTTSARAAPRAVMQPDWVRRPTAEEMQNFYPKAAAAFLIPGEVRVRCAVKVTGDLDDCRIVDERPARFGFGAATLRMAPIFKMRPLLVDGRPAPGGHVEVPIHFRPRPFPTVEPLPPFDDEALADARRIVALIPPGDPFGAMIAQPFGMQDDGETPPETMLAALNAARDALATHAVELRDVPARALALTFSREELEQMAVLAESASTRPQVFAALHARYDQIMAAVQRVAPTYLQPAHSEALAAFCRTHDCGVSPP